MFGIGRLYVYAGAGLLALTLFGAHVVQVSTLKRHVAEEREHGARLAASLEVQNQAVQTMRQAASAARAQAAQALAAAKVVSSSHRKSVDALQGRILASASTSCSPAVAEIREMLK